MKFRRQVLVCLPLFALPFLLPVFSSDPPGEAGYFHTDEERAAFASLPASRGIGTSSPLSLLDTMLPTGYNYLFAGSGVCLKCHGYDTSGVASVDVFGEDVNVVDDWRATMMANSARDPFWRAKVSHEVLVNPQHQQAIEDKCTTCHAPMGHFNAKHLGYPHYGMDSVLLDPLALDGVSCLACHMQQAEGAGFSFSGELHFDTFKVAYGPYTAPLVSPMLTETGYKPKFSEHVEDAGDCAGCHTLLTETIDLQGNLTGSHFVEQATYHEWLNSAYNDSLTCQGCHMPSLDKYPVFLVTGAETEARSPFFLHEFVGGNVTMLGLLRDNTAGLGLKASPAQFDDVISKTLNLLQNKTLDLELTAGERDFDTARFTLKLTNRAGHKFPSGYPSRRAFIQFVVQTEAGDTVFVSGKTDADFEVFGQNPTYEPHYQIISSEEEVQIYELVMGDVDGGVTTVLERADHPLKDNRLPPLGFTTSHPAYDTTRIAGGALADADFNKTDSGEEGSGSDVLRYHVPLNGEYGLLFASAKVFYQSVPPKWNQEMFAHNSPDIDAFRTMFDAADRTPVLIREASAAMDALSGISEPPGGGIFVQLHPVPSADGRVFVKSTLAHDLRAYDLKGRLVAVFNRKSGSYELRLEGRGVFLLRFEGAGGRVQVERVVVQ